jgi:NADH:ubiquinone oxidoreductase subunit 6 (subunit J)
MDYLMQLASFGFLGAYLLVCLAVPVFLAGIGELGAVRVAVAVLAIAILCAAFVLSLFPVPEGPWRYLPYVFAGMLAAGMVVTSRMKRARPSDPPAEPSAA